LSKFNDKTIVSIEDQINFLKDQVTDLSRYCNLMKRTIKKLENNNAKLSAGKEKITKTSFKSE
jgi:hypothetical protein